MKYIKRIFAAPFVFGIYAVIYFLLPFKGTFMFLRYGGEFLGYMKDDKETISKIYATLKEQEKA